jgi:hypothetical protein
MTKLVKVAEQFNEDEISDAWDVLGTIHHGRTSGY